MATLSGITSGYTITARARITSITGTTAFKTDRLRNKSVYEGTEDRGAVSIDIDNSLINYGTITSITINYSGRASNTFYDTPTGRTGYIDSNGNESWAGSGSSNYHSKAFSRKSGTPKAFSDTWTNPPRSNDGRYRFLIGVINEQELTHIEWAEVTSISLNITYTPHTCSYTTVQGSETASTCCKKGSKKEQCSICGATRTVELALNPNNHAGGTEIKNAKSATCTATGYTGDTYCKGCGAKIASGSTIAKLAHTEITMPAVAPTCTATGLTEGKKCSVCGTIITAQQTVAALGHNYTSVVTQPTENSKGYTTYTCSRCGNSYVDSYTCLVTVKMNNDSYGTVTGSGVYDNGKTATLTAKANDGYKFVKWNDGNTSATRTINVTNSATYTAVFAVDKILIGTTKPTAIYLDETNKIITFVVSGTITNSGSAGADTVDGYHIKISNSAPQSGALVSAVYIDEIKAYG